MTKVLVSEMEKAALADRLDSSLEQLSLAALEGASEKIEELNREIRGVISSALVLSQPENDLNWLRRNLVSALDRIRETSRNLEVQVHSAMRRQTGEVIYLRVDSNR